MKPDELALAAVKAIYEQRRRKEKAVLVIKIGRQPGIRKKYMRLAPKDKTSPDGTIRETCEDGCIVAFQAIDVLGYLIIKNLVKVR